MVFIFFNACLFKLCPSSINFVDDIQENFEPNNNLSSKKPMKNFDSIFWKERHFYYFTAIPVHLRYKLLVS